MSQVAYEVETKRTFKIDGEVYNLPEYVKFVTRDSDNPHVAYFGWEHRPEWTTDHGYYRDGGKRERLIAEPKPARANPGRFFAAV